MSDLPDVSTVFEWIRGESEGRVEWEDIQREEQDLIRGRRRREKLDEGTPAEDAVGLALSGGGVRSATFNLGLLQALHKYDYLKRVDYLSTVSGGGYVGSALGWFLNSCNREFPFPKKPEKYSGQTPLKWIRQHGSYLTPGDGLNLWSLVSAFLRGLVVNLLIISPILLLIGYILSWPVSKQPSDLISGLELFSLPVWRENDLIPWLSIIGMGVLVFLAVLMLLYAAKTKLPINWAFAKNRRVVVRHGRILKIGTVLALLGILPLLAGWNSWQPQLIEVISSAAGIISLVTGWIGLKGRDETGGIRAFLLRAGLVLILVAILIVAYRIGTILHAKDTLTLLGFRVSTLWAVVGAVVFSIGLGLWADTNHVSMHRYYRHRLLEAYLPLFRGPDVDFSAADAFYLQDNDVRKTGGPYQIINCNLNTCGSDRPEYRARGGANFIMTPEFVGSEATGYCRSKDYKEGKLSVATAMSVSGAAVDPNTGVTRSRPLALIMSLLNVRLGVWFPNPRFNPLLERRNLAFPFWHYYALREMLGWNMDETQYYVHLSDGGHIENLGLYELVHRRCPFIIVSDASADPDWEFKDLARACEMVRVDFGAEVRLNIRDFDFNRRTGFSKQGFIYGKIEYKDGEQSLLIYLKTAVLERGLPPDIYGYKRVNPKFPDQPTTNQFFDEIQFEAYRELGYRVGELLLKGWDKKNPDGIFV